MKKQNLNEQLSRIKQMMNLDEERVDLDNYKEQTPIISDMESVGVEDGKVIISMVLNIFVADHNDYSKNTMGRSGNNAKVKVVTKWNPGREWERKRGPNPKYMEPTLSDVISVESDIEIPEEYKALIKQLFKGMISTDNLISSMYYPYLIHTSKNGTEEEVQKVREVRDQDMKKLYSLVTSARQTPPVDKEVPPVEKQTPKDNKDMWTSTSTWDKLKK